MRYTSVIVLMGTSAAQSSRRAALGTGQELALLGPASMSRQNDQCWHRTTRTEHRIYGILSVSRETCIRASRFSCCSRGSRVSSFEEECAMNAWRYPSLMCFECNTWRTTLPAAPQACMDVNAQTGVPAHQNMEHARSMQRDRVSRETCRLPQSHSIPAHTTSAS